MPHGKICYLEIPANREEDSAAFYSSIFGWKVRQRGDGNLAFDDAGSVSGTWVKAANRTPDGVAFLIDHGFISVPASQTTQREQVLSLPQSRG